MVRSAISTLSFSEMEAITHIFDELNGMEGILVASKIADRVGITRSVIVNALRKFESAGVIESRSSGMKGTYIKVLNDVVFDEIELYFHPDLQRRFLSLIISALRNIHIDHVEGVNLLLVTHSPFVLSDIPRSNVLVLSDKEQMEGETFCANIHEMLGQSFFMEYSMGQIAQEEVERIFSRYNAILSGNNQPIDEEEWKRFQYVSSIVGDEYLHSALERVMKGLEKYVERRQQK